MSAKGKLITPRENFFAIARKVISEVGQTVKSTMGPQGGTVVIGQEYGDPICTKDGARVMRSIDYSDPVKQIVFRMMKQASENTDTLGGDGTTTTCVLFEGLCHRALRAVESGRDPRRIMRGISIAEDIVIKNLKSMTRAYGSQEELCCVATLAADGDKEIGEIVAKALIEVGKNGMVTIEEGKSTKPLDYQRTEGLCMDRSFASPFFVTNERGTAEFENPFILMSFNKISSISQILPALEFVMSNKGGHGRPLVIIADDFETDVLNILLINKYKAGLKICPVKSPGFGDKKFELLEDVATVTGGKVLSEETGLVLEQDNMPLVQEILGEASKIISTKDKTTITFKKDGSCRTSIANRIAMLREKLAKTTSSFEQEKIHERIAKLDGGVVIIHIGGTSEIEMKERKDAADDALYAAMGAREEGVVPGGGASLVYISKKLSDSESIHDDEIAGIQIVKQTLHEPIRAIIENGETDGAALSIIRELLESGSETKAYDARDKKMVDAIKNGLVDSSKVLRLAITHSFSAVRSLLKVGFAISDLKCDGKNEHSHGRGGPGKYGVEDFDY